jgi:hypothetical protein
MEGPTTKSDGKGVTPDEAYVALLANSGHFDDLDPGRIPGFRPLETSTALRALTDASKDEIPNSVRIAVLYDLARRQYPDRDTMHDIEQDEYVRLAASVIGSRDVDPGVMLNRDPRVRILSV